MRNNINVEVVKILAENIKNNYIDFDVTSFINRIIPIEDELGLFERLDRVTKALHEELPDDFPITSQILLNSLGPEITDERVDLDDVDLGSSSGFIIIALTNYISDYGLNYFDISMNALYEMTKRFTSEGSIRHFIINNREQTLKIMEKWAIDENVHVRRLVSEGSRPRLPWAVRLSDFIIDPSPILPLLELLKNDKELYVRRSVANNLNDIAKDHPDIVVKTLKQWDKDRSKEMKWLIKHALRTLIKKGDPGALEIMGYTRDPKLELLDFKIDRVVTLGDELNFSFNLLSKSPEDQKLVIDFIIYHKKANGKLTPKVFKLKNLKIMAGDSIKIKKKHGIRKISTRKYYPGEHRLALQINGKIFLEKTFKLKI